MDIKTRDATTTFGHHVTVFENDHIGNKILKNGLYEKENIHFLIGLLAQLDEPVIFDVGANIGNHALAFSTVASAVYAFEPQPDAYTLLRKNITQNHIKNIEAYQLALSDKSEWRPFHIHDNNNYGTSGFYPRRETSHVISVKADTGDNFAHLKKINKLDFIKMDIEGHEQFALEGLSRCLAEFLPLVQIEWTFPEAIKKTNDSKIMLFLKNNYHFYVLGSNHDRSYWKNSRMALIRRKLARTFTRRNVRLSLLSR